MLPKSSSLYAKRMKKLGNENKLLPFPFHNKKQKEKKGNDTLVPGVLSPSLFQT
jgi:hypothetical protein